MLLRPWHSVIFFFNDTATTEIYTLSLHDALPIWQPHADGLEHGAGSDAPRRSEPRGAGAADDLHAAVGTALRVAVRSEEHTSELQSRLHLVCRLLLEKKKRRVEVI